MAILKAPLLSLGAQKLFGKTIVYKDWRGVPLAAAYTIPSHRPDAKQEDNKAKVTRDVYAWQNLVVAQTDRDAYKLLGRHVYRGLPGYQSFIRASYSASTTGTMPILTAVTGSTQGPTEASISFERDNINDPGNKPAGTYPYRVYIGDSPTNFTEVYYKSTGDWDDTYITLGDWRYPFYFSIVDLTSNVRSGIYRLTA